MRKLTRTPTPIRPILASELTQLPLINIGSILRGQRTRCQIPYQTDRPGTLPINTQLRPVIAPCFIIPRTRLRTLCRQSIALRGLRTFRLGLADLLLPVGYEMAGLAAAARPLAGAALSIRPPLAPLRRGVQLPIFNADYPGIAAVVMALVVIVTAVALLPRFHYFITAKSTSRSRETVPLFAVVYGIEDVGNVANATAGKFTVIRTVPARG